MTNGLTNCMHGDERWACMQPACKELIMCTKLCVKTSLGSTPMLFKKVSYFCVWNQLIFGTIRSDIHNLFHLRSCCKIYLYLVLCNTCENNFNSTHLKLILNCMWFCFLRAGIFPSTFLQPVNSSKNWILNWVMKLNLFMCFSSFLFLKHLERFSILFAYSSYSLV